MPKQQSKTRDERRKERSNNYLGGKARKAFFRTLQSNVKKPQKHRAHCWTIYAQNAYLFFLGLQICSWSLLTGSNLKRVKHINPSPIHPDGKHYRDIKCQNEWLQQNIFDVMGNYLFYCSGVRSAFHISKQTRAQQRNVQRQASATPLIDRKKSDAEQQRLPVYCNAKGC